MTLATADRHDLLRIIEIDAFDTDRLAEHLRAERTRQVLLQHAEKSHALFGFAVGIDDRFLDERLDRGLPSARRAAMFLGMGYAAACRRKDVDQPFGVNCPIRRCG